MPLDRDDLPHPGDPATPTPAVPSAGEALSRGGGALETPGDDVLVHEERDEER